MPNDPTPEEPRKITELHIGYDLPDGSTNAMSSVVTYFYDAEGQFIRREPPAGDDEPPDEAHIVG